MKSTLIKVLAITLILIIWGKASNLDANQWASWVQAIGGIAAVVAAILLGAQQSASAAKLAAEQSADTIAAIEYSSNLTAKEKRKGLVLLLETVFSYADQCYILLKDGRDGGDFYAHANRITPISGLISTLDEISYIDTANSSGLESLINLKFQMLLLQERIKANDAKFQKNTPAGVTTLPVVSGICEVCAHIQGSALGIIAAIDPSTFQRLNGSARPIVSPLRGLTIFTEEPIE